MYFSNDINETKQLERKRLENYLLINRFSNKKRQIEERINYI
jgi:hypothetical protein